MVLWVNPFGLCCVFPPLPQAIMEFHGIHSGLWHRGGDGRGQTRPYVENPSLLQPLVVATMADADKCRRTSRRNLGVRRLANHAVCSMQGVCGPNQGHARFCDLVYQSRCWYFRHGDQRPGLLWLYFNLSPLQRPSRSEQRLTSGGQLLRLMCDSSFALPV